MQKLPMMGNFNTTMKRMPLASPVSPAKNAAKEIESSKRKNPKIPFVSPFCNLISCSCSAAFSHLRDSLYFSVSNPQSGHVAFPSRKNLRLISPMYFCRNGFDQIP